MTCWQCDKAQQQQLVLPEQQQAVRQQQHLQASFLQAAAASLAL
jgi:hypothetical protein